MRFLKISTYLSLSWVTVYTRSKKIKSIFRPQSQGSTYMRVRHIAYEEGDIWVTDGPAVAAARGLAGGSRHVNNSTVPDNANRTDAGNYCGASPIQYSFIKKMTKRT